MRNLLYIPIAILMVACSKDDSPKEVEQPTGEMAEVTFNVNRINVDKGNIGAKGAPSAKFDDPLIDYTGNDWDYRSHYPATWSTSSDPSVPANILKIELAGWEESNGRLLYHIFVTNSGPNDDTIIINYQNDLGLVYQVSFTIPGNSSLKMIRRWELTQQNRPDPSRPWSFGFGVTSSSTLEVVNSDLSSVPPYVIGGPQPFICSTAPYLTDYDTDSSNRVVSQITSIGNVDYVRVQLSNASTDVINVIGVIDTRTGGYIYQFPEIYVLPPDHEIWLSVPRSLWVNNPGLESAVQFQLNTSLLSAPIYESEVFEITGSTTLSGSFQYSLINECIPPEPAICEFGVLPDFNLPTEFTLELSSMTGGGVIYLENIIVGNNTRQIPLDRYYISGWSGTQNDIPSAYENEPEYAIIDYYDIDFRSQNSATLEFKLNDMILIQKDYIDLSTLEFTVGTLTVPQANVYDFGDYVGFYSLAWRSNSNVDVSFSDTQGTPYSHTWNSLIGGEIFRLRVCPDASTGITTQEGSFETFNDLTL